MPPLADGVVTTVGYPIAAVVAESRYLARDAAELVEVEYEPLPGVSDPEAALAPGAPVLHEELGTNRAFAAAFGSPAEEVEAALAGAEHVVVLRVDAFRPPSVPVRLHQAPPRLVLSLFQPLPLAPPSGPAAGARG